MRLATVVSVLALLVGGCGGSGGGGGGSGPPTGSTGSTGTTGSYVCSDLFDQSTLRTYSIDITPDEWNSIQAEFHDIATLTADGNDFATKHPVTFHMGSETAADATFKLHGQSSWVQTVMFDGPREKMQFDISFHEHDPMGTFHGVEKLVFDMTRDDWTFMHDRLAHTWFRQAGVAAGCAASARVEINGSYYGLFVAEETTNKRVIADFFPDNPNGDLWKAAAQPETNKMPDQGRLATFKSATNIAAVTAIVDLDPSLREWAGEALINDADGYYGGNHNFYIYDTGAKGFVFLPNDTDATFNWLGTFDVVPFDDHPVYWWERRTPPQPTAHTTWRAVMADPASRARYADAMAAMLAKWDVAELQGWVDTWSQQIADAVASDPHTSVTAAQFQSAVAATRDVIAKRAEFLQSFVDCTKNGTGDDKDGDGKRWCEDCRDDNAAVHPGAAEICGNGIDDDCNGVADDGC
jgi:hypothetical protein